MTILLSALMLQRNADKEALREWAASVFNDVLTQRVSP